MSRAHLAAVAVVVVVGVEKMGSREVESSVAMRWSKGAAIVYCWEGVFCLEDGNVSRQDKAKQQRQAERKTTQTATIYTAGREGNRGGLKRHPHGEFTYGNEGIGSHGPCMDRAGHGMGWLDAMMLA